MAPKKPKRRRKKRRSRYHRGVHKSPKSLFAINYRSGWELLVCQYLDADPNVVSYLYESFKIPYVANSKTGKLRNYIPDFLVEMASGEKLLVEVKRSDKLAQPKVKKKIAAAQVWCSENHAEYQLWTNEKISEIAKQQKV